MDRVISQISYVGLLSSVWKNKEHLASGPMPNKHKLSGGPSLWYFRCHILLFWCFCAPISKFSDLNYDLKSHNFYPKCQNFESRQDKFIYAAHFSNKSIQSALHKTSNTSRQSAKNPPHLYAIQNVIKGAFARGVPALATEPLGCPHAKAPSLPHWLHVIPYPPLHA